METKQTTYQSSQVWNMHNSECWDSYSVTSPVLPLNNTKQPKQLTSVSLCLSWPATLRQAVRGRDPSSQQSDSNVVSWLRLSVTLFPHYSPVFTTSSTSSIVITSDRFKYRSHLITSNTHFHRAGWITVLWQILLLLDNVIQSNTMAEFQHCFMIRRGTFKPSEQIFSFSDNKDWLCFRPQHSNRFCN